MNWKSPVLAVSATIIAGSVALVPDGHADQRLLTFSGVAAGLVLLGVWIGKES